MRFERVGSGREVTRDHAVSPGDGYSEVRIAGAIHRDGGLVGGSDKRGIEDMTAIEAELRDEDALIHGLIGILHGKVSGLGRTRHISVTLWIDRDIAPLISTAAAQKCRVGEGDRRIDNQR